MVGQILKAINNLYTVKTDDNRIYINRIKGKKLALEGYEYNPLCCGDFVQFTPYSDNEGLITQRLERKSTFTRWNVKLEKNQTIAANMDQVCIITSASSPPFRPRFLDRAISCASGCEVIIVMNKCDYFLTEDELERFRLYKSLGYKTICLSAKDNKNIDLLENELRGKVTAFVGQSGVGKSTLVNMIIRPEKEQSTNEISQKYQRGRHTTNHSIMLTRDDITLIDTPGVRELLSPLEDKYYLLKAFPEFNNFSCQYSSCLHLDEPNCKVKEALEEGLIDFDRYESYVRMQESLDERSPSYMRTKFRKNKQ